MSLLFLVTYVLLIFIYRNIVYMSILVLTDYESFYLSELSSRDKERQ